MTACYFCGQKATSREHAPARSMFKGFSCDSITVPSCDAHNTEKSHHDQAIVSAFLIPLHAMTEQLPRRRWNIHPDVMRAIAQGKSAFPYTKKRAVSKQIADHPLLKRIAMPDSVYVPPSVSIHDWIRLLTAAMIFSAARTVDPTINWKRALVWSPDWLAKPRNTEVSLEYAAAEFKSNRELEEQIAKEVTWNVGWSASPRPYPSSIYCFDVGILRDTAAVFRHRLYSLYRWYAAFEASPQTVARLRQKIDSLPKGLG
jgi:hypothetical protein